MSRYRVNISLHQACEDGNLCLVKYILKHDLSDINLIGSSGLTPVMVAVRKAQVAIFNFLLSQGCNMSVVAENGDNLLHAACVGGSTDIVKRIIARQKHDVNSRGWNKWTPILYAVYCGHREVFDLLENKGADLKKVTARKENILHAACMGGHVEMLEYMVEKNVAGIESRDSSGKTPVMWAAKKGHTEVFYFLVNKGCNLTSVSNSKDTILHFACQGGQLRIVKHLLTKHVIDINSRDKSGKTPAMFAARYGQIAVFELLVSAGCDMMNVDNNGFSILHVACFGGHVDMVENLLNRNIFSIECKSCRGRTPVMVAAVAGRVEVVELLVTRGCNVITLDTDGNNILHVACIGGSVATVKFLLTRHIAYKESPGPNNMTPLMTATFYGHKDVAHLLVRKGCNLKAVDKFNNSVLHLASFSGCVDIVRYILSQGVDNIESRDYLGRTPVMKATKMGFIDVVDVLIRKGCKLTTVNDYGDSILHMACSGGDVDMVKYILSKHAVSIDRRGRGGRTPLLVAARKGHERVVHLLVKRNCNLRAVDDGGSNAIHLACVGAHVRVVKYLLSKGVDGRQENKKGATPLQIAQYKKNTAIVALITSRRR